MRLDPSMLLLLSRRGVCAALALALAAFVPAPHGIEAAPSKESREDGGVVISPSLRIESLEFGRVEFDRHGGTQHFIPTTSAAMIPGKGYGWRMKVVTTRREIRWTERLTLPTAPKTWGITSNVRLSPDRRRATTKGSSFPSEGVIENVWIFAEGDPVGRYEIELEVEGVRVGAGHVDVHR